MGAVRRVRADLKYEIAGISLLGLSFLGFLFLFNPSAGVIGRFINEFLKVLSGEGRYIIPFLLALAGFKLLGKRGKNRISLNFYGVAILGVVALILVHLVVPLDHSLAAGLAGEGGGLVGGVGSFILRHSFGTVGTYVILLNMTIVGIILMTNLSLRVLFRSAGEKSKKLLKKTRRAVNDFLYVAQDNGDEAKKFEEPVIIDGGGEAEIKIERDEGEEDGEGVERAGKESIYFSETAVDRKRDGGVLKIKVCGAELSLPSSSEEDDDLRYQLPPLEILKRSYRPRSSKSSKDIAESIKVLESTLESFGVKARVTQVSRGPAITRYEIQPPPGVKVSRIVSLADNIALSMAAPDVRIEAPIPGKAAVGIEVPNKEITTVYLRELIETPEFQSASSKLSVALGKDIAGGVVIADLAKMPHLLIAGATGSGKSVCLNTIIASILFKATPREVKFLMIDPKMVELATYNGIPHLVSPVVTNLKKAATALRWAVREMECRYEQFARAGVRDIARYNEIVKNGDGATELPYLVIVIDELADLMMVAPVDVEDAICRLAQMARAAGMHLVVATQRPSVDVITGLIKANIPSRISFAVSSQIDSRTILDIGGAEKLLGRGDMLFYPVGAPKPLRVQGAFLSDTEVENLVNFLKKQGQPIYEAEFKEEDRKGEVEELYEDELLPQAVKIFVEAGYASISMLQRRLHIGYSRAARLVDIMEREGIIGSYEGNRPRAVLINMEQYRQRFPSLKIDQDLRGKRLQER